MLTWAIRAILATAILLVAALALGSRSLAPAPPPTPSPELPAPTATTVPTLAPTPRPSATPAPFVERIISRISRETPAPYPTSTPLPASMAFVSAVDFGYMPSVTRIKVGQTVVWRNGGRELHDVTGDDDWYSGPLDPDSEYRHTFGFVGTFTYRCSVHPDMRGTVIVS